MLIALVAANLVVRQMLLARFDERVDAALDQEVEELRLLAEEGIDPASGEPFGDDVEALFDTFLRRNVPDDSETIYTLVDGEPFLTSFAPHAPLLADGSMLELARNATEPRRVGVDTEAGEARLLIVPVSAGSTVESQGSEGDILGTFVVAYFLESERAEIAQALGAVTLVSAAVLVPASVAAWTLAGRVLRPVARLTDTATEITESDLSARIPVEGHDELAQLGHTFNAMLDRLESAVISQRRFLNDVAHDLRTPLTIVSGHLEMIDDDPEKRAETLALVDDELDRMGRYVSDLLILAKAEQPDFLRLGLVDLGEWAEDLLANAERLGSRTFVLSDAPVAGSAFAEFDGERMTQAALNLVLNAVQHTAEGGEIRLAVQVVRSDVEVTVADSGPGVDLDLVPHLFERTSRGDRSRDSRREGTGLGLAIVAAIADAHGGEVRVDNEPGRGVEFTIVVPLDPAGRVGSIEDPVEDPVMEDE